MGCVSSKSEKQSRSNCLVLKRRRSKDRQNTYKTTTTKNDNKAEAVPFRAPTIDIHPNATWTQNGVTVAGGNGEGDNLNQLSSPLGLCVDDEQTIYVVDGNSRIMKWGRDATSGQVAAGGSGSNQLRCAEDVIVDKDRDSLIISDFLNRSIVRWPRQNATEGETIISNCDCRGLTIDENGFLYVADDVKDEVRRYGIGDTEGTVVAGGNGSGHRLNQLNRPSRLFVDRDHSVYVSEWGNHRVTKWEEGATQGIVVAGGEEPGNSLKQLCNPNGIVVDQLGTVYVADQGNGRIMRWPKGARKGSVIAGGNGEGGLSNQSIYPIGLSFDRQGNLYVADYFNHRVQKFNIE